MFSNPTRKKKSRLLLDPIIFSAFVLALALRQVIPLNINLDSPDDDYLGVRMASSLLRGHWLGTWSNTTLLKPPGYSLFLAFAHFIPIPVDTILQFIFLLLFLKFTAVIFQDSSYRIRTVKNLQRLAFVLLAFNPYLYSADISRVYRTSLNTLALTAFYITFLQLLKNESLKRTKSNTITRKLELVLYAALGFEIAVAFLTRTESYWLIYPCVLSLTLYVAFEIFRDIRDVRGKAKVKESQDIKRKIWSKVIPFVLVIFFSIIPIFTISTLNYHFYGSYLIDDMSSGNFVRALKLWEGVENGKDSRLDVPISEGQRLAVYAISPTAALLKPLLDQKSNVSFWTSFNCQINHVCDNPGGAFLPFQYRDAAMEIKSFHSEKEFQDFFQTIATDILNACQAKEIRCGPGGSGPGMVNISEMPKTKLIRSAGEVFANMLNYGIVNDGYVSNRNNPVLKQSWSDVLKLPLVTSPNSAKNSKVLTNLLLLLQFLYSRLSFVLAVLSLMSFRLLWQDRHHSINLGIILLSLFCLILFSFGLASISIAWGFPALGIYTVPAQPVFLMTVIFGSVVSLEKLNLRRRDLSKKG